MTQLLLGNALAAMLPIAVPMWIEKIQARGGPTDDDFDRVRDFADVLAWKGDILLCGGKPGEAANLFNDLAYAVAVMAFLPNGVRFCGERFVAGPAEQKGAPA